MAQVNLSYDEAFDLIYLVKSIIAQSEYNENIELYTLREDALCANSAEELRRLHAIMKKLADAYGIRLSLGDCFN